MRVQDIVLQMRATLPFNTNLISNNLSVTSIVPSGSDALATTATSHGLTIGQSVVITGADSPLAITSLTRSGVVGTAVFSDAHDYTFGVTLNIIIDFANESEFNGTFVITEVSNRFNVEFTMVDTGATTATGSPQGLNAGSFLQSYNGVFSVVSVPSTNTFTYTPINPKTLDATGTIFARTDVRVSGALSLERAQDSYTAQAQQQVWLFVTVGTVSANRSRDIKSDFVDNLQRTQQGSGFRQQTNQAFSVYAFIPTSDSISGRVESDLAQELFIPICKSLLFFEFDSLYAEGKQNSVQFDEHGFEGYNTAFYVHRYSFEMPADLSFGDTVGFSDDVAFRDISLIMGLSTGSELFTTDLDLDDEPV